MWTIVRFTLANPESHRYGAALDLLARGGFGVRVVPSPDPLPPSLSKGDASGGCGGTSHGTVAGDVHADTALVTRCVFTALQSAGFSPVMVSARHSDRGAAPEPAGPGLPLRHLGGA